MNEFTTKITINGYSSQKPIFDLSDYIVSSIYTRRQRITRILLFSAIIPHTWSSVDARFNNDEVRVTVKLGLSTNVYVIKINPLAAVISTPAEVAAMLQLGLNASTPHTWTVVYDSVKKTMTVAVTSPGVTFSFVAYDSFSPDAIKNRALTLLGFSKIATVLPYAVYTSSKTGEVVDMQPIKHITIRVDRFNESTDNDRNGAKSHFIVPVNANYGEYVTFTPNSAFINEAYIADHSAELANFRIRICDADGELIPFHGGDTSLVIEFKTKSEKHTRDHVY